MKFFCLMLVGLALAGSACRDRGPAVRTANGVRELGHASDAILAEVCERAYLRAAELPWAQAGEEVLRVDRIGCQEAAVAHDVLRAAHGSLVQVLENVDDGRCNGMPLSRPPDCDLITALAEVVDASTRLGVALGEARVELERIDGARQEPPR